MPDIALAVSAGDLPAIAFTTPGQRECDNSPIIVLPALISPKLRAPVICLLRTSWKFASCCRRRAWPSRARQFIPCHPRRACQLLAQRPHCRAHRRFARLTSPSPCMLAISPPLPSPCMAIASAVIHPPSSSPRATATRSTSPSPRAGGLPVVAFAVVPATAPRTQDYPLPRGEVNKKYIHMPRGYF